MKYLIISEHGDYLPIALKLHKEGHNVKFHVRQKDKRNIGKGMVPTVSNIPKDVDITIIDTYTTTEFAEKVPGKVFVASEFTDFFCTSRDYFEDICDLLELDHDTTLFPDNCIEGWFNGDRFVLPIFFHKYYSKLLNGDLGSVVEDGYMGVVSDKKYELGELYQKTLKKLEPVLKKSGYKGIMKLEMKGEKVCRPSFRFNIPTMFEMLDMPLSYLIKDTVNGDLKYIKTGKDRAVGVRISIPPFPYCPRYFWQHGAFQIAGKKLFSPNDEQTKHMWMQNVYRDNGTVMASGHSGDLGYVTSRASQHNLREGMKRIRRTITNLGIQDVQYRTDIGC